MNLNPFNREKKELSAAQRNRKVIRDTAFKVIAAIMITIAIVYAGISALLGSSLFIPQDAQGVLDSVKTPSSYTWSVETVRRVTLLDQEQEQHSARSATVDTERNKFQLQAINVLPEPAQYLSDGSKTVLLNEDEAAAETGTPWLLVTDWCNEAPSVPVETVTFPSAQMLKEADPQIDDDKASFLAQRSWKLDFTLTPTILKQLMWISFFEQVANDQMEWVIPEKELSAIEQNDYTVDYANAWVTREDRQLMQIDTRVTINDGSSYRILAQVVPNPGLEEPLKDTFLSEENIQCTAPGQ